jgi:hypothetical protein
MSSIIRFCSLIILTSMMAFAISEADAQYSAPSGGYFEHRFGTTTRNKSSSGAPSSYTSTHGHR